MRWYHWLERRRRKGNGEKEEKRTEFAACTYISRCPYMSCRRGWRAGSCSCLHFDFDFFFLVFASLALFYLGGGIPFHSILMTYDQRQVTDDWTRWRGGAVRGCGGGWVDGKDNKIRGMVDGWADGRTDRRDNTLLPHGTVWMGFRFVSFRRRGLCVVGWAGTCNGAF